MSGNDGVIWFITPGAACLICPWHAGQYLPQYLTAGEELAKFGMENTKAIGDCIEKSAPSSGDFARRSCKNFFTAQNPQGPLASDMQRQRHHVVERLDEIDADAVIEEMLDRSGDVSERRQGSLHILGR